MRIMNNLLTHPGIVAVALLSILGYTPWDACAQDREEVSVYFVTLVNPPANKTYLLGSQIEVSCTVYYEGPHASDGYVVTYYLSRPGNGHVLGSVTGGPMESGESVQVVKTLTLPDDYPRGSADIRLTAMLPGETIPDWHNWGWAGTIRILAWRPNLTLSGIDAADGTYGPGQDVAVRMTVKNNGAKSSGSYSVECFAGDYRIGGTNRDSLELDQVDKFEVQCKLPDDIPEGDYRVSVVATCADDDNPADNKGYDSSSIPVRLFPDLTFQSLHAAPGVYSPDGQIVVRSVVQNIGKKPSGAYTISYYMSQDSTITPRDHLIGRSTHSGLAPGQQQSNEATCQLPSYIPAGNCYVGAFLACPSDVYTRNDGGMDETPVAVIHPPGYVCGQITYKDLENWQHPVRYGLVKVYDADDNTNPLDDRVIGETYTDQDGNYGSLVLMDDKSGRQVYVKAFTQAVPGAYAGATSGVCSVRDDVLQEVYSLKSSLYGHPRDTSRTISMTAYTGEFMVYDSVIEGFHKAKTFFGIEPNEIVTYWPSSDGGTYYEPGGGIHIAQGDRGDRDVIMHEYGHYVAQLGNFAQGDVGDRPQHYWNIDLRYSPSNRIEEHARNLAFREAWATLFSIATQYGDTWYCYSGDVKYQDYDEKLRTRFTLDLEKETGYHRRPGEFYENMNASTLWDIFDDNCDGVDNQDTLSDTGLTKIWTVLNESKPENMKRFWNAWFERFSYAKEMIRLFSDNGMSFPYLGPSAAVEGFETGDFSAFAWIHPTDGRWIVTPDVRHQGAYSARTGILGNSQKIALEISIKVDGGPIRFWRKVSTEEGFDKVQFLIDGSVMCEWSGEHDWEQFAFSVQPGTHTFTWTYGKNYTTAEGADAAWIDDIEFPVW